ncbi:MAG: DNA polymerase III subunit alpha [Bacteroidetes bacterium]|jgi:DNA polymerase III subunit alpha|nr:DNA polymerase III subunit alpha [Bacteroidota bacterium]MBT6687566.1 DNA polymerase III subunit alpha [Bacteroidota bacterium]MBT7142797.1 DNA polymerase III subunit alpha [Bacteroidota bacterium]MBT7492000.1 DNA polymerase III subunit alpha [Bacteroidota bacterium]
MAEFTHLHLHTEYSVLDGASRISTLLEKAKTDGMNSVAITDHGNMYGAIDFHTKATKLKIKPIIGVETYVARRGISQKSTKEDNSGFHLILLAKNKIGYNNLIKLVSTANLDGFYYKPRVDKELLRKYKEGIIASSACLGGEVPQSIMNFGKEKAREKILEYKEIFGEDFYLELMRHKSEVPGMDARVFEYQEQVNKTLIELATELNIKYIATNDVHFVNEEDAEAHDRLICLSTQKDFDDPNRLRYTKQEWFKTSDEMQAIFADLPEAIKNTQEIADKVEEYEIFQKAIMPDFPIPENYTNADEYLKHLTYEGAKIRYPELSEKIRGRIDFELDIIQWMGYPGYFLIVQDFLHQARKMGVSVGPGRGSAAGSVVAYCNKITDIDPIKYDLLFERFLNPERISMPDIDIDFDEDGRSKVMKWVVEKYGQERVAQIITFGSMAAKNSIRDVARVENLPLSESNRLAKLVPDKPGTKLKEAFEKVPELKAAKNSENELIKRTLKYAVALEGTVRNVGTHACGVIIGRDNLTDHVPLSKLKDAVMPVTQYDGNYVEKAGMLKMDFLGLKTLSIIKDTIENIKISKNFDLEIDKISFEDKKTFELYSNGDTTGVFQFESDGMRKYLKELKPNRFEDIIAMNALYRPGPIEYIPSYIKRKNGREKIEYDLPVMEKYLSETYGITVYQEQVMLLSQEMANFTKGQADTLRKAMGKKIKSMMDESREKFVVGCTENNLDTKKIEKVWKDWEKFAEYAFNKSHSTCYAFVSFRMAYLKAHYPAEFMAAVLSRNLNNIEKITELMAECQRMKIPVLGPDVNESHLRFNVNNNGEIRFGMAAIKGVGEAAVNEIINKRKEKGNFKDIYDFVEKVNIRTVSKRTLESLAVSGAFDNISNLNRSQYFHANLNEQTFIEHLIKYANKIDEENQSAQFSLFGDLEEATIVKPQPLACEEWSALQKLNKEKEAIGIYLSAHPLDQYRFEIDTFCKDKLSKLADIEPLRDKELTFGGLVTKADSLQSKNGKPYGDLRVEDYSGSHKFRVFGKKYLELKQFFVNNYYVVIKGKVTPRYGSEEDLEFRINSIDLLSELSKQIKSITLNLSLNEINDVFLKEFPTALKKNQGDVLLKFTIVEPDDKIHINLFSRKFKIKLSNDFINYLKMMEINYQIN